ncbi:hypothetical protein FRC12_014094 [Ceratobasidium sp. 428]|nr:hypothetical protein FRC12_014094 [Ceratobasidium sp. 428]
MIDTQIKYQDPAPTPTNLCFDDVLENQLMHLIKGAYEQGCQDLTTEPESITKKQYQELRHSLGNTSLWEPPDFRAGSRKKLADLTQTQFVKLAIDVHDEVVRITRLKHGIASVATSLLPQISCLTFFMTSVVVSRSSEMGRQNLTNLLVALSSMGAAQPQIQTLPTGH